MLRLIRWVSLSLLALLVIAWGGLWWADAYPQGPAGRLAARLTASLRGEPAATGVPPGVEIGGPFRLVNQNGQPVTDQDFRGRWMLVYFGYSYCPDVCPTELQTMTAAVDKLGADAEKVVPVFVTIDPERDTPKVLADYVQLFSPRLVGLTGSPEEIAKIAREYRVYYAKVTRKDGGDYLMDHSSFIYLMGPQGRLRVLFHPGDSPDTMAASIGSQIKKTG